MSNRYLCTQRAEARCYYNKIIKPNFLKIYLIDMRYKGKAKVPAVLI